MSILHRKNDTPATPIGIVQTWGTDKQVSAFIEDIWPVNWTKEAFDHYVGSDDEKKTCQKCGHPFDLDSLGKYGCPDCHGEGLQKPDLLDCIHQGDSPREDLMWRSPNGTRFPVRKSRKGGAS